MADSPKRGRVTYKLQEILSTTIKPYSDGKSLEKSEGGKAVQKLCRLPTVDPGKCLEALGKPRKAKVTLLGADNPTGLAAAFSLKTNGPHLKELRLWDSGVSIRNAGKDLSHIPTSVRVQTYMGEGQLEQALRESDVVVVMGGRWGGSQESAADLFYTNSESVRELARAVILAAPRALVGLAVPPVTSIVAFFGELQKSLGAFCPDRLVGLLSLEEMRTRSFLAQYLSLPPSAVDVRLAGGGTPITLIPVLEGGPGGEFLGVESIVLTQKIRNHTEAVKREGRNPDLAAGLAVANFVRAASKGICTDVRPIVNALAYSTDLPGVPYLALPVILGPYGIEGVVGMPRLSEREFRLLIQALPKIKDDISIGETWAHSKRHAALSLQCN